MVFDLIKSGEENWNDFSFNLLKDSIDTINVKQNLCNIMLTGGSTANDLYKAWKNKFLTIKKNLNIFLTDERCVPETSHLNNYFNLINSLYDNIPSHHKIFPIYDDTQDIKKNIKDYESKLPGYIDVTLISLGSGGHIASIFKNFEKNNSDFKLLQITAPVEPFKRITTTISYINNSRKVFLLVKGIEKAKILNTFVNDKLSNSCIMPMSFLNKATILIDHIGYQHLSLQSLEYFKHKPANN